MFILDGKPLPQNTAFDHNGIQYPANWLTLSTLEDLNAIGITEVPDYPRPDDRFYWVTQNDNGTWDAEPMDLATLKLSWVKQVETTADPPPSDWMVVRRSETGTEIPANWLTYREAVRTNAATNKANLNAANDLDAFIAVATNLIWPVSPA